MLGEGWGVGCVGGAVGVIVSGRDMRLFFFFQIRQYYL